MPKRAPKKDPDGPQDGLTLKQRLFVRYFLGEAKGNATEAARRAGYAKPSEQGYENLRKPQISAAIEAHLDEVALSSDEVLARLSDHASGDASDFIVIDKGGEPRLDLRKAKRAGKLHLIKKLRPTQFGVAIELYDAQSALALLGKYHGLFDRIDLSDAQNEELEERTGGEDQGRTSEA